MALVKEVLGGTDQRGSGWHWSKRFVGGTGERGSGWH